MPRYEDDTPQTSDPDEFGPPTGAAADFAPLEEARPAAPDEHLKDSIDAQALYDRAMQEAQRGDENDAVVHFLRASKLAETAREWYLVAAACHRIGDVFRTPGSGYDLARALRMYHRAIAAYQQCGLFEEAHQLTYRAACLRLWRGGELRVPLGRRLGQFLYWAVAGFGLRPARVLFSAAAIVLVYALVYWQIGGAVPPDDRYAGGCDFPTALYFSGITFTTVGFGDLVPAPHARLIAMSEGAIGFALVSFFVVVLANRLRT